MNHTAPITHTTNRHRRIARAATVALCMATSVFAVAFDSGCTLVGVAAAKLAPDPTIPAKYVPEKAPTLILVENYHNPASLRLESDSVASAVMSDLKANSVAPLIDPQEAADLRHKDVDAYRKMPLDAIGKAVGARQVIYIDLEQFDVTHALASDLFAGNATVRVRVVGETGEMLWPTDTAGGYPLSVKVDPQRNGQNGGEDAVRQQLTAAVADKIGKLFHPWQSESSDGAAEQFDQQQ